MGGTANPGWSKAKHAARGVHLEQDTAGRLLDGMGDHVGREMIVRTICLVRQNPAYRPVASISVTTSDNTSSEVVHLSTEKSGRYMSFSGRHERLFFGIIFSVACTTTRSSLPPASIPAPAPPIGQVPVPIVQSAGAWAFRYQPGFAEYQVARSATITRLDTVGNTELSTNTSHESVTLDSTDLGVNFVGVVDGFTTTTQGLIGPVQPTQLPVQVSGSFTSGGLIINSQTPGEKCNPVHSVLFADLYNLLVPFPQQLSPGTSWTDSVEIRGCPAGVPTVSHTIRAFTVTGEVTYDGHPAVLVQRVDTTRAQGEGGLQQHRVSIEAHGTGTAAYYLDVASGRIMHLTTNQTVLLGVTAASRQYQLKQDSKQEFGIVR
jgi:hypothetical protein